jgi:hypothetical protein
MEKHRHRVGGSLKNSSIVYAFIADGELHEIGEFYSELEKNIDPAVAMRAFINYYSYKNSGKPSKGRFKDATMDQKVAAGKEKHLKNSLFHMEQDGYILLDKAHANIKNWTIILTEAGNERLRTHKFVRGCFWSAVMIMWDRGLLKVVPIKEKADAPASKIGA